MVRDSFSYLFLFNLIFLVFIILYFIHKYYYFIDDSKYVYNKMTYSSN